MSLRFSPAQVIVLASLFALQPARGQADATSLDEEPLVRALRDELARSRTLQLPGMSQPYYVAYTVRDVRWREVAGEFGGIVRDAEGRQRLLTISLRTGSPRLDNTGIAGGATEALGPIALTLDDNYATLRRQLWLATDGAYKRATEALEAQRAAVARAPRESDHPDDFVLPAPTRIVAASAMGATPLAGSAGSAKAGSAAADPAKAGSPEQGLALVRRLGARCWEFPAIDESAVRLWTSSTTRTFLASSGNLVRDLQSVVTLDATASTRPPDGPALTQHWREAAPTLATLPPDSVLETAWRGALEELVRRRTADFGRDYSGPVLFEGRAAAQLVRTLLAAQLTGTPAPLGLPAELSSASAFEDKRGRLVVDERLDIVDDPTLLRFRGQPLLGSYAADDEGISPRRVTLVTRGKLQGLLMSLAPRRGERGSNGHGRFTLLGPAAARPANLLVSGRGGLSHAALVRRLVTLAQRAGEPYGLIVRLLDDRGTGPFQELMRSTQTAALLPLVVVAVGRDGRETPLRGIGLAPIPLSAFKRLIATGSTPAIDHAVAPSFADQRAGPLRSSSSVVTPALLFAELDLKRRPPRPAPASLLPRPER
ncbi:MAG: hypothetical protein IPL40_04230 [Proteobacteria bacterium]|nr:hypothetical protein [Pseudomonadota bacterium]